MNVIKLGGSLLHDRARRDVILTSIAASFRSGQPTVVVHGGGKHVDAMLKQLGLSTRTHAGLRITDDATLEVVVAVLSGTVNKLVTNELIAHGVRAAGISGSDGPTLIAERHPAIDGVDLGNVGRVVSADRTVIDSMLNAGVVPVISSVARSIDGALLNVNADTAAAAIAIALRADSLQFFTDVDGVLDASGTVIPHLSLRAAEALLRGDGIAGGMRPKLEAALHALRCGVHSIAIGESGGTLLSPREDRATTPVHSTSEAGTGNKPRATRVINSERGGSDAVA